MKLIAFNASSIGASHTRVGKECQDYSISEIDDKWCIVATCDGHGGDNYFRSALGSQFAAETALQCLREFLAECSSAELDKPDDAILQLEKSIIARWNERVWVHFDENPFTKEELDSVSEDRRKRLLSGKSIESTYGTTLIAIAWTNEFWFALQIGDGKAVRIKEDGSADCPIPINEKCFLNTTTSICDIDALDNFRHYYSTEFPAGIFCGSDGIDDSFIRDEQLFKLYLTIGRSFADNSFESAISELEDYLPRLSSKGSGDDVSIAGIMNLESAGSAFPALEESSEEITDSESQQSKTESGECVGCVCDKELPEHDIEPAGIKPQNTLSEASCNPDFDEKIEAAVVTELVDDECVKNEDSETEDKACQDTDSDMLNQLEMEGEQLLLDSSRDDSVQIPNEDTLKANEPFDTEIEQAREERDFSLVICPNCGYETKEDFSFCPKCATPLKE